MSSLHAPHHANAVRSPTPIPSAHEGRAPAAICKNPKRLPNIHANGMPVVTSRGGPWEGDEESAENTVDSNRLEAARWFDRRGLAPIVRPTTAGNDQFTFMDLSIN
jgi:hypothetical protein